MAIMKFKHAVVLTFMGLFSWLWWQNVVLAQTLKPPTELTATDVNSLNLANGGLESEDLNVNIGADGSGLDVSVLTSDPLVKTSNFDGYLNLSWFPYYAASTNSGASYSVTSGPVVIQAYLGSKQYLFVVGGGSGSNTGSPYPTATSINMWGGPYAEYNHNGERLSCTGNYQQFYADGICTLTLRDGTLVEYQAMPHSLATPQQSYGWIASVKIASITKPDGEIVKISPTTITSSMGWMVKYVSTSSTDESRYAINTSAIYCDPNATTCNFDPNMPQVRKVTSGYVVTIWRNNIKFITYETIPRALPQANSVLATLPSGVLRTYYKDGNLFGNPLEVALGNRVWTYNNTTLSNGSVSIASRTNPDGGIDTYTFGAGNITSFTNALNQKVTYQYTGQQNLGGRGRVWKIYPPENTNATQGPYAEYTYDTEGNLTETRAVAKSGSGLADIVTTAQFPTSCSNFKTCHKPLWISDANNKQTDYTYDSTHGGVLTETGPADSAGVRPQTRYTYTQLYPKILNASGVLVNSTPVWRLTKTSSCRTATAANPASCVGTDQETVTEYEYANNNVLLTKVTVRAGNANIANAASPTNVWQSTSYDYDTVGNQIMVDGPLPGTIDRSYTVYDVLRRPVYEIGIDPDGSGTLPSIAVHHMYDIDGREYRTETGRGNGTNMRTCSPTAATCTYFIVTSYVQRTYDATTGLEVKSITAQP